MWGILVITLLSIILVIALNTPAFTNVWANTVVDSTFYIPKRNNIHFDGNTILREACFGATYYDTQEKALILHRDLTTPLNDNSSYKNPPENSIEPIIEAKPDGMFPIIECDLSTDNILQLNNTTALSVNTQYLLGAEYDFELSSNSKEPLVLILHTHATECYSREGSTYYDPLGNTRSTDDDVNMVAVGKTIAEKLNEYGITTLHCTLQHDADSYRDAYSKSADTIKKYLTAYPSIKYVFDIHRDAVMYDDSSKAKAVCKIGDNNAAQIMILAGTDAGGADFPHWRKNLSLALKITDKIEKNHPGIMRSVALRGASYNQQYTDGSLLIEIGTDGNTLSEAKLSGEIFAESFAKLIKEE